MAVGKYSPDCPNADKPWEFYDRNARGEIPKPKAEGEPYDEESDFANYDPGGFDSYGYSAYDRDGDFVGMNRGIDRLGHTEDEYASDYAQGGDLWDEP